MKCPLCSHEMAKTVLADYRYGECGLPNVSLHDVPARECSSCGHRLISLPRMTELHQQLAGLIAKQRARLTGPEIRFLRKHLGWSAKDFAARIGVDPATVSRWENGHDPMGGTADRALRVMAMYGRPVEEYPLEQLADVAQDDAPTPSFGFRASSKGWRAA